MPSKYLDPEQAKRQAEHRYDFGRRGLGGRVVLVPGGAGGLGAAITALLLQEGALPVVGYRSGRGHALAFQQKLQDLYGGLLTLVEGDVSQAEARQRYLQAALDLKGELYGLVALTGDPARVKPDALDGSQPWYTAAGAVPEKIPITDDEGNVVKEYDLLEAGGKTWYLPVASFPGETPYRLVDKSHAFRTYFGLDLGLSKRLSHRWMASAAVTLQDQRSHRNGSVIDPTSQWALDGKPYGNRADGIGGKAPVQMFARWMAKVSALYQMPWGITAAMTLQAREGWRIPHYVTLAFADEESWEGLYRSNVVYLQSPTKDRLSSYRNLSFRLEKSMALGSGRVTFMADVFNVFNWATVNRAYDAYLGTPRCGWSSGRSCLRWAMKRPASANALRSSS